MKYYGKITDPKDLITLEKGQELASDVLPSQSEHAGKFLTTDGTNVSWGTAQGEPASYLKSASVSGNTLNLVNKDDTTTIFTPTEQYQGTVKSVGAGEGLLIQGESTVEPSVIIASTHKLPTNVEWSEISTGRLPSSASAGDAMVYDGTDWTKQGGYGYTKQITGNIVENRTLTDFEEFTSGAYVTIDKTPELLDIIVGSTYVITWAGTNYTCEAFQIAEGMIGLGNKQFIGGTASSEPFMYATKVAVSGSTLEDIWVTTSNSDVVVTVNGLHNRLYKIDSKYVINSNIENGTGKLSIKQGSGTTASESNSHAEGFNTTASAMNSHAEGDSTTASGTDSHAEGLATTASGRSAHAEGIVTTASGDFSHAEGSSTIASGDFSHAEGSGTIASGYYTHTEGGGTTAESSFEHVQGRFNILDYGVKGKYNTTTTYAVNDYVYHNSDVYKCITAVTTPETWNSTKWEKQSSKYAHITGNGTSGLSRSNAETLDWNGNLWTKADVMTGGTDMNAPAHKLSTKITEPATEGTIGQVLTTDGAGGRIWTTVSSGGGTVTSVSVSMNGATKGTVTTSGTIDLGTVLTSHQDISGKEDASNKVISWSSTTTDTHYPSEKLVKDSLNNLFNIDKRFVCVGASGDSYYSTDGLTWNAMTGLDASKQYNSVAQGKGRFVCVGTSGSSFSSTDGVTWVAMSGLDTSKHYNGVTYNNDRFICVGPAGKSYYSTDGLTWTTMSGLDTYYNYTSVIYGNDRFVCVGTAGQSFYSTDGLTWNPMTGLNSAYFYNSVTYGNGRFVCVGQTGSSYYSVDGLTWNIMSGLSIDNYYYGVAYGNNRFVCVGDGGSSYYSTDGLTWTTMSGLGSTGYKSVTYGLNKFVCVGYVGKSFYSTDGLTWTAMTGLESKLYNGVIYGEKESHYHNAYYTKPETDALLLTKSNSNHTHSEYVLKGSTANVLASAAVL